MLFQKVQLSFNRQIIPLSPLKNGPWKNLPGAVFSFYFFGT